MGVGDLEVDVLARQSGQGWRETGGTRPGPGRYKPCDTEPGQADSSGSQERAAFNKLCHGELSYGFLTHPKPEMKVEETGRSTNCLPHRSALLLVVRTLRGGAFAPPSPATCNLSPVVVCLI